MNEFERIMATRLSQCRFLPGSREKRFVRHMASLAKHESDTELTHRQRKRLGRLYWNYREQLLFHGWQVFTKNRKPILERDLHSGLTHFPITRIAKTKIADGDLLFEANYEPDAYHCFVITEVEFYFCKAAGVEEVSASQMRQEYRQGMQNRRTGQLRMAI